MPSNKTLNYRRLRMILLNLSNYGHYYFLLDRGVRQNLDTSKYKNARDTLTTSQALAIRRKAYLCIKQTH